MKQRAHVNTSEAALNVKAARGGPGVPVPAEAGARENGAVPHAIRVLCVDDHAVLVEGLKAQFAIDGKIEVVGRLATADRLVEEVKRLKVAAVLLDIEMPGADAFEMADRVKRSFPAVRIIVLSAHVRDAYISASFLSGVSAYFSKSDELEDIVGGIHEVVQGRNASFLLGPRVRERCRVEASRDGAVPGRGDVLLTVTGQPMTRLASLTPRESEILRLIGKGLSRQQIAAQLCRSAKTVDGHQDRMMKKLGVESRSDLIRLAIREGLVQA